MYRKGDGLSVHPYSSSSPVPTCKHFEKFTTTRLQSDMLWQVSIARRQLETVKDAKRLRLVPDVFTRLPAGRQNSLHTLYDPTPSEWCVPSTSDRVLDIAMGHCAVSVGFRREEGIRTRKGRDRSKALSR